MLIVTPTFHPEPVGTPHYVTDFVRHLAASGPPVRVVTNQPYYPGFRRYPGYGRAQRHDTFGSVPVYRLPTIVPNAGRRLSRLVSEANMLFQVIVAVMLRRLERAHSVVAVSPGSPAAILAGRFLRLPAGRLVVMVHDIGFGLANTTGGLLGRLLAGSIRRVEVWGLNRADRVTVLSDHMGATLRSAGVVSPIETVGLWPTVGRAKVTPEAVVLYSGNLGRKQGVHRLLDLAANIRSQAPESRVVIRGEGSQRKRLIETTRARGLENVTFEDFVPAADLATSLAAARVHVVPQSPEGAEYAVPSKIVNVLAAGRPVIVTAHPDSPIGQLSGLCGAVILVDPADDRALADEVLRIMSLPDEEYQDLCVQARSWAAGVTREDAITRTVGDLVAEGGSWGRP